MPIMLAISIARCHYWARRWSITCPIIVIHPRRLVITAGTIIIARGDIADYYTFPRRKRRRFLLSSTARLLLVPSSPSFAFFHITFLLRMMRRSFWALRNKILAGNIFTYGGSSAALASMTSAEFRRLSTPPSSRVLRLRRGCQFIYVGSPPSSICLMHEL